MPQGLTIVGGGPGALAPLFAAASSGALQALLSRGVTILEKSRSFGAGGLSAVTIKSDSPAEAFLDIVANSQEPELAALRQHPIALEIAQSRSHSVPLPLAVELLDLASEKLLSIVKSHASCEVVTDCEVISVKRTGSRLWEVSSLDASGELRTTITSSVHLATGAHQPLSRLQTELVAGAPLLPRYADKLMQTGELFTAAGTARLVEMLGGKAERKVVIVGASTSAGAAAVHLLRRTPIQFATGGVTVMHRSPLRLFYNSVVEARADGYADFRDEDVCPLTGRVFRLSGFRFDSKELLREAFSLGGATPDARLRLFPMEGRDAESQSLLAEADLIVAALGYIPRMCRIIDEHEEIIELHTPRRGDWAMVDQTNTVITHAGLPLDGLTAMGLAIGPAASPERGGEANFRGQVNSLWLWQNRLGLHVVESALRRSKQQAIPLLRPSPPKLSQHAEELASLEESNIYTNFGPVNTRLEKDLVDTFFNGAGSCVTTCNATLALMLAIKDAVGDPTGARRFALMPSFTFPAAAQAALWCGLTPLFCDIDPHTWLPCHTSEQALLDRFGDQVAVVVPNATFGNNLDLDWYHRLQASTGIPVVVDAAACLGSLDDRGHSFASGSPLPVIFSLHATKSFSTGEGGFIYSADADLLVRLRAMSSFGFGATRIPTMMGLNAKLSEVAALTASLQLRKFPQQVETRLQIAAWYEEVLEPSFVRQQLNGRTQIRSFQSLLLPREVAPKREEIRAFLLRRGIQTGTYFSPHLAQQPYLQGRSECVPLPVSDDIASRILSLPLSLETGEKDVAWIALALEQAVAFTSPIPATGVPTLQVATGV